MVSTFRKHKVLSIALTAVLLVGLVIVNRGASDNSRTYTIVFSQTKNLYPGDDVAVLGVPVGRVLSVEPDADSVTVKIRVKGDQKIPADAKAIIVSPSLVSVRRVELAPAYSGGDELVDGDTIPISRTAIPVEWDDIKEQLVRLTSALGPDGANKDGALSDLVTATADNLNGRGDTINETVTALSQALQTLSDGRGDLFATVRNLQVFTSAIEQSDAAVVDFNQRLNGVSSFLNKDRKELAAALKALEEAFPKVAKFLKDNRKLLTSTLDELQGPAKMLADNRQNIADILQVAPGTLSNVYNIINPDIPALTGAFALNNFSDASMFICSALLNVGGTAADCHSALEPLAKYLGVSAPPIGLAPLMQNGYNNVDPVPVGGSNGAEGAPAPSSAGAPASPDLLAELQKMLGGAK